MPVKLDIDGVVQGPVIPISDWTAALAKWRATDRWLDSLADTIAQRREGASNAAKKSLDELQTKVEGCRRELCEAKLPKALDPAVDRADAINKALYDLEPLPEEHDDHSGLNIIDAVHGYRGADLGWFDRELSNDQNLWMALGEVT